jgi:hypothetical protein
LFTFHILRFYRARRYFVEAPRLPWLGVWSS